MPNNNRVHFGITQFGFSKPGFQTFIAAHGVQNIGMTTNYNLLQVLELGQLAIYHNAEQLPDVEITAEKCLDGYPLLGHLATNGSVGTDLAGRSNAETIVGMTIFPDTQKSASGAPIAELQSSGMFLNNWSFNFPVDGFFTESVSLIGNNKVWRTANMIFSGVFVGNNDTPLALGSGLGGVNRRQHMIFDYPALALDGNNQVNATAGANRATVLPPDIPGISSSGTNDRDALGEFSAHVRNVSTSVNLGREGLFELGRQGPYHRFVAFPVEVTCDIEVTAHTGDLVSATEAGVVSAGVNLSERTIKIATKEGTFIDLGTHNKLSNISYGGGGTDGSNLTITFSYRTYDDFTVNHLQDPSF